MLQRYGYGQDGDLLGALDDALNGAVPAEVPETQSVGVPPKPRCHCCDSDAGESYFFSFAFERTEHPNGGAVFNGFGNISMIIPGGIDCYEKIEAAQQIIAAKMLAPKGANNPKVFILAFYPFPNRQPTPPKQ
jgi:hypothetical protein